MTNEEAILRLAQDAEDDSALLAFAENNLDTLRVTVKRHFSGSAERNRLLITLLIRISWRAKYFIPGHDHADKWVEGCAEMESKRLKSELRSVVDGVSRGDGNTLAIYVLNDLLLGVRTKADLTSPAGVGVQENEETCGGSYHNLWKIDALHG
jgi:hypothetical protein